MDDKTLAEAVIALGVGDYNTFGLGAEIGEFVREWRVAGALIEKAVKAGCVVDCAPIARTDAFDMDGPYVAECNNAKKLGHVVDGDNIPRIIIEACVESLT